MVHIPYLSLDPLRDALGRSGTLWDHGRSVSVGPIEKGSLIRERPENPNASSSIGFGDHRLLFRREGRREGSIQGAATVCSWVKKPKAGNKHDGVVQ